MPLTCSRSWRQQRSPRRGERVVRIEDGEAGLAARTIARRLSSVAGLFEYLLARGDAGVASNPVPRGLASRRAGRRGRGGVRLVRTPRTLPRVLSPAGGRPAAGRAAHAARSGDGAGDAARRAAPLRGARPAAVRRERRRAAGSHRVREGRAGADRAGLRPVLRRAGRVSRARASCRGGDGGVLRGAEGPAARAAAVGGRVG